jgi:hypothetical protein
VPRKSAPDPRAKALEKLRGLEGSLAVVVAEAPRLLREVREVIAAIEPKKEPEGEQQTLD